MDIDRDGDSNIDQQQPTGEQRVMQHMTAIGQNMLEAIQQGTEAMMGRLNVGCSKTLWSLITTT